MIENTTPTPVGLSAKELTDIYLNQGAAQNTLWTTFLVGLFATGSFAVTSHPAYQYFIVGFAYVTFAIGHGYLVHAALEVRRAVSRDIALLLSANATGSVRSKTLEYLARDAWEAHLFMALHVAVDLCAVIALLCGAWTAHASDLHPAGHLSRLSISFSPATSPPP